MASETQLPGSDQTFTDQLYLRVKSAHKMTGISEAEIYKAIYACELRALKYKSRVWLIAPRDLNDWIARSTESNIA